MVLEDIIELETWTLLKNYWRFGTWFEFEKSAYDDEDIFRDDRAWVYATEKLKFYGFWLKSDRRKKIIFLLTLVAVMLNVEVEDILPILVSFINRLIL